MDASFGFPSGIAVDLSGNLVVTDNNRIRIVTPESVVSMLAGSGEEAFAEGAGAAASFNYPHDVAVETSGSIVVADTFNHIIRKVTPRGVASTLAGNVGFHFADGTGVAASFYYPSGVAVDAIGNVIVADTNNNCIRKVTPEASGVTLRMRLFSSSATKILPAASTATP